MATPRSNKYVVSSLTAYVGNARPAPSLTLTAPGTATGNVGSLSGNFTVSLVEVTGILRTTSLGSNYGGNGRHSRYNTLTNQWVSGTSASGSIPGGDGSPWQRITQCTARNGRIVYFLRTPIGNVSGSGGSDGWYGSLNLDTNVFTQSQSPDQLGLGGYQFTDGLTRDSFRRYSSYFDGQAAVYIPAINRIWMTTWNSAATTTVYEINPTTTPWTIGLAPTAGAYPNYTGYNWRHMMWCPQLNAVICNASGVENMRVFKF